MIGLFKSLFGCNSPDDDPEVLVKAAIEHAVDSTDPWIRAVSGYKKKLRPAVLRAINYVVALVDDMSSPIVMNSENYVTDSRLRPFFISSSDMWQVLGKCMSSTGFRQCREGTMPLIYTVLTMEKKERPFLGAEIIGDIVLRDVLHHAVSFESHRLTDPAESADETRRKLKIRAFNHLLSLALNRITAVKIKRGEFERHRALLQSKLELMQRTGWGFDVVATDGGMDVDEVEALLGNIETELLGLGGNDKMLDVYLDIVNDVLKRPEEQIWMKKETLFIDRMGVKHNEPADGTQEVSFDLVCDSEKSSLVALLVAIPREAMQNNEPCNANNGRHQGARLWDEQ